MRSPISGSGSAKGGIAERAGAGRIVEDQDAGQRSVFRRRQADGALHGEGQVRAVAFHVDRNVGPAQRRMVVHEQRTLLDNENPRRERHVGAIGDLEAFAIDAGLQRAGPAADLQLVVIARADFGRRARRQRVVQPRAIEHRFGGELGAGGASSSARGAGQGGGQNGAVLGLHAGGMFGIGVDHAAGSGHLRRPLQMDCGARSLFEREQAERQRTVELGGGGRRHRGLAVPKELTHERMEIVLRDDLDGELGEVQTSGDTAAAGWRARTYATATACCAARRLSPSAFSRAAAIAAASAKLCSSLLSRAYMP